MAEVLSIHVQIWNIETCQNHFKKESGERGKGMGENNGGDEPSQNIIHVYMEMSQ
jgi:hypothetical protein